MDEMPLPVRMMSNYMGFVGLVLGNESGALDALVSGGPATSGELAGRSGLDERNITVWLRAMAAAGLVVRDGDSFRACEGLAMVLSDEMPIDFRAVLGLNYEFLGAPVHAVVGAMASGSGLAPATWATIAPYVVRVNAPTWRMVLVDEFIAADPALVERLRSGGAIGDLACGNGDAARLMADAFPKARVDGYDPSAPEANGDDRVRLSRVTELPVDTYDLVTCLDSMHHLGDPAAAASAAHGSLRPGGTFLVAEEDRTGDPAVDDQDPMSVVTHMASLLYCMQDNLANGGTGETPSGGLAWVDRALDAAGFETTSFASESGYRVFLARKPVSSRD